MLSVSHMTTGALIASSIDNPLLAAPLVLASHYLEDAIPHWDAGTGLSGGHKSAKLAFLHELPDLLLGTVLVLLLFPIPLPLFSEPLELLKLPQVWGPILALLPDFLEAPRNFLNREPRWFAPLNRFHHSFHHSIPRVIDGLAPQFILLILIFLTAL